MIKAAKKYFHWLHGQWPAGHVEKLPELQKDGSTNISGLYVVGDLQGIPLLKFSIDSGTKAVRSLYADKKIQATKTSHPPAALPQTGQSVYDLVIIGGGVSGMAAALEAKKFGLNYIVLEASEPFSTVVNFPKAKPIFTYPNDMRPAGDLIVSAQVKEPLIEELKRQTHGKVETRTSFAERTVKKGNIFEINLRGEPPIQAQRVIVAIGRSGNFRKLGVPGEELDKVYNRLHDPQDYAGKNCLVVGGGDSALETAIALTKAGANVTLSYRKPDFARAKPENIEMVQMLAKDPQAEAKVSNPISERVTTATGSFMPEAPSTGQLRLRTSSVVKKIASDSVTLQTAAGGEEQIPNDVVFTMIGREAPLDFFRRSGIHITGEWSASRITTLALSLAAFTFVYHWKKTGINGFDHIPLLRGITKIGDIFAQHQWFPYNITAHWKNAVSPLAQTLKITLGEPGFYYSLAYCLIIVGFGYKRIRTRATPYVKAQTWTLALVQIIPLFLLPYIVLPWMGHAGAFDSGFLKKMADALFPIADYGHGREYWRSFGLILAWPLFFWNVFTHQPMWAWLFISAVQTFVVIPGIIYFWGKGAYCGWICSCGALAETLGDSHRTKMPHGPFWNKLNMAGQVILFAAFALLLFRILGWMQVGWAEKAYDYIFHDLPVFNYVWFVDLFLAGIIGVGLYFHFSGRVWCRFFCPLAALMHIYSRFSRFGIISNKKKCISCNVCTSVCHMGIDVMNFANKGLSMQDPQCVRCSACVSSCPTGVLNFGQVDKIGRVIKSDSIPASAVQIKEGK
ncbi:MAG: Ferredoxin--NADP reductase [Elusimicrobia bacterium]|nr:Ferredoxin--NADP reductase [Elusimicrobiota bacterium]